MKKIIFVYLNILLLILTMTDTIYADEENEIILNARAAVLMDADSGRILYGKDADTAYPLASTTKVMTLIVALENADSSAIATASSYAASMPEVRMGVHTGETYRLEDLYYALMLESYNDAAVMIAETVAGSVEAFADKMNEKAQTIGCEQTHFITPNGLDATDEEGAHAASAKDLALIMRYAIGNKQFLQITQTRSYTFSDLSGQRTFSLNNKNALFDQMDGVLSGKTGFTGNAGYCYVCAVQTDDKCLIIALLGSGWPPNKNYKWQDVKKLVAYGDKNYHYQTFQISDFFNDETVQVTGGVTPTVRIVPETDSFQILMRNDEQIVAESFLPGQLKAPVTAGETTGLIRLSVSDFEIVQKKYQIAESIASDNFCFILSSVIKAFLVD